MLDLILSLFLSEKIDNYENHPCPKPTSSTANVNARTFTSDWIVSVFLDMGFISSEARFLAKQACKKVQHFEADLIETNYKLYSKCWL